MTIQTPPCPPEYQLHAVVLRVVDGDLTVEQAAAEWLAADRYAALYAEPSTPPGWDVAWQNRQIVGGRDAARAQALYSAWWSVRAAAQCEVERRDRAQAASRPRYTPPTPRYTCPRCGEHRDGNCPGHCDDCES